MERNNEQYDKVDHLIRDAMHERPEIPMPPDFTDRFMLRYEKRMAWNELISVFAIKTGLVLASLAILTVFLIFPLKEALNPFLSWILDKWELITGIGIIILFTFFIDQVLLKFYNIIFHEH
jgi:hypothetical protein